MIHLSIYFSFCVSQDSVVLDSSQDSVISQGEYEGGAVENCRWDESRMLIFSFSEHSSIDQFD